MVFNFSDASKTGFSCNSILNAFLTVQLVVFNYRSFEKNKSVSCYLQLLFDFLAFKNDISFWKKKRSMIGMSTKAGTGQNAKCACAI